MVKGQNHYRRLGQWRYFDHRFEVVEDRHVGCAPVVFKGAPWGPAAAMFTICCIASLQAIVCAPAWASGGYEWWLTTVIPTSLVVPLVGGRRTHTPQYKRLSAYSTLVSLSSIATIVLNGLSDAPRTMLLAFTHLAVLSAFFAITDRHRPREHEHLKVAVAT